MEIGSLSVDLYLSQSSDALGLYQERGAGLTRCYSQLLTGLDWVWLADWTQSVQSSPLNDREWLDDWTILLEVPWLDRLDRLADWTCRPVMPGQGPVNDLADWTRVHWYRLCAIMHCAVMTVIRIGEPGKIIGPT